MRVPLNLAYFKSKISSLSLTFDSLGIARASSRADYCGLSPALLF